MNGNSNFNTLLLFLLPILSNIKSLQVQVTQLVTENKNLKQLVKDNLEEDISARLLMECNCDIPTGLKSSTQRKPEAQNQALTSPTGTLKNVLHDNDYELYSTIRCAQRSFIITDPSLPDNPIMFASPGFLALSKYSLEEVIGRNCRFMQGPHTDTNEVEKLRKGINDGVDTSVVLLNYKKDGTAFYNQIFVAGLRDATGKIINYVGVQSEVKLAGRKGRNGAPAVASPQHKSSGAGQAGSSGTTARTSKRGRTQRSSSSRDTVSAEATGSGIGMGMTDDGSELGLITGPAVSINGAQVDHIQSGALPPLPASSSSPAQGITGLPDGFSLYGGTPSDFRFTLIGDDPRRSRSNSLSFPPPMTDTLPQGVVGSQMDVSDQGEGQTETGTGTGTNTKGDVLSEEEDVKMEVREVSPRDLHSPALPG